MNNNPYQPPEIQETAVHVSSPPLTVMQILFSMTGRISRQTYWIYSLLAPFIILIPITLLSALLQDQSIIPLVLLLLSFIPLTWVKICISGKRWHDLDKSALWIFIEFIPFIGGIWALIECGFLPGTNGPNQFGSDPT